MSTDRDRQEATTLWTVSRLEQRVRELTAQLASATARAEAAEADRDALARDVAGLRYRIEQKDNRNVELRAQLAAVLALVDRHGADQWRRGASNKEPQEFAEWRREQP